MRIRNFTMGLGAVGLLGAVLVAPKWTATLSSTDGSGLAGTATVEAKGDTKMPNPTDTTAAAMPQQGAGEVTASINITGGKQNAALAWGLHEGKCGGSGPMVGSASDYPKIQADGSGSGQATATINRDLTEGQEYSVAVHGGDSPDAPVAACGDLRSGDRTAVPE
jgi:hypothetical protein